MRVTWPEPPESTPAPGDLGSGPPELDTGDGKAVAVIGDGHVRAPGQVADDDVGDGQQHGARGEEETAIEESEAEADRSPQASERP